MIKELTNVFKVEDLRKKLMFTLLIVVLYRLGSFVPIPGVPRGIFTRLFRESSILGFLNIFTGGALENLAIFALGIMPYITASIIMELLTVVIPRVEQWAKEGEEGRRKIVQCSRYLTLVLAFIQSFFIMNSLGLDVPVINKVIIVITLVSGMALIMWMAELITQRGIGNGMSLLIFTSIVSRFPQAVAETIQIASPVYIGLVVVVVCLAIAGIIFVEQGQRRIPVSYAKRIVGRRVYGGASTYLPVKINSAGVIPIIFASSVLFFPAAMAKVMPSGILQNLANSLESASFLYLFLYFVLIIFFTFFYSEIIFNPVRLAEDLQKWGGFIPGVRPGAPTTEYINRILKRVTFPGAVFLGIVTLFPTILLSQTKIPFFEFFGGTSILITVGVALETVKKIEAQLLMRHYEGLLK